MNPWASLFAQTASRGWIQTLQSKNILRSLRMVKTERTNMTFERGVTCFQFE